MVQRWQVVRAAPAEPDADAPILYGRRNWLETCVKVETVVSASVAAAIASTLEPRSAHLVLSPMARMRAAKPAHVSDCSFWPGAVPELRKPEPPHRRLRIRRAEPLALHPLVARFGCESRSAVDTDEISSMSARVVTPADLISNFAWRCRVSVDLLL